MPPHLHPRSRLTTTLFTGTLAVSFLVVGMPHLLPCPVQPRAFADGPIPGDEQQQKRRRRRRKASEETETSTGGEEQVDALAHMQMESGRKRECPVPKPGGLVGQIMGFPARKEEGGAAVVRIEKFSDRRRKEKDGVDVR
jgi:cytochrome c oxidase assembly factor 2